MGGSEPDRAALPAKSRGLPKDNVSCGLDPLDNLLECGTIFLRVERGVRCVRPAQHMPRRIRRKRAKNNLRKSQ